MSVEYKLFLREKPKLEVDAVGAMSLSLEPYDAKPGEAFRWVIEASGRISDYDEWIAFAHRMCRRFGGRLWSAQTNDFEELPDNIDDEDEDSWEAEQAEADAFEQLVRRATTTPSVMEELRSARMQATFAFRTYFSLFLVRIAADGVPVEPWEWGLRFLRGLERETPMLTPRSRASFAKKGTLAARIVQVFDEDQARLHDKAVAQRNALASRERARIESWVTEPDIDPPLVEKRRRGGEMHAGIPRSTTALLIAGKLDAAVAEYANRYALAPAIARKVVTPHHASIVKLFRADAPKRRKR